MYNEGKHKLQREGITLLSGHLNCYAATENLLSVLLLTQELKKDLKDWSNYIKHTLFVYCLLYTDWENAISLSY